MLGCWMTLYNKILCWLASRLALQGFDQILAGVATEDFILNYYFNSPIPSKECIVFVYMYFSKNYFKK